MNKFTNILKLAAFVALLGGCDTTEENPDPPDLKVLPVDPEIPTGLEDCRIDTVYADQSQARLMTRYEFDNTIEDLLGIQTTVARDSFPSENANSGFENNSDSHIVSPLYVRKLMEAAEGLSLRALSENGPTLIGCDLAEDGCGHQFIEGFLDTAFRRPVEPEELQIFIDLYDTVEADSNAETATQRVIETTLQSPQFLYRVELSDDHAPGSLVPVEPHELAQRLSYFLWGTMPDQALRDAADSGGLATESEVKQQVNRMIKDPKMARNIEQFYRQWLSLDSLETMVKDDVAYPDWNASVSEDWKTSLYAYVNHVHTTGGDVNTLLSSPTMFLTEQLAPIYGERPQLGLQAYNANPDERAGLLTSTRSHGAPRLSESKLARTSRNLCSRAVALSETSASAS